MAAPDFPLDPNIFWEIVASFAEYDYSFTGHTPDPSAKPGYPGDLIRRAQDRAPGLATALDADGAQPTNYLGRRYTNCCMFVEAVLVGTALRTHADFGPQWTKERHAWAMNNGQPGEAQFGPPRAYAAVGIADEPLDIATAKPVPGEIYVIQGLTHNWFIVDCDEKGLCLRLEATFANGLHPEIDLPRKGVAGPAGTAAGKDYFGGVVHGGFRRVGPKPEREAWTKALRDRKGFGSTWNWETLQAGLLRDLRAPGGDAYVSMARVRMRPASSGPWLPYAIADATGRPLAGQSALADAWRRTLAANAPFPLGINRTWHNGIHLEAPVGTPVFPFASGELVAARFPAPTGDGVDQGSVIVRHRFDRKALAFLAIDEPKRDDEVEFYSAVVHLQGGPAGATRLVDTLCPPTTPPDACVLAQAELDVFVVDRDGAARELAASAWINACDRPLPAAVELPGIAPRLVVRLEEHERYAAAWTPAAPGPITAPATAHGGLFDADTQTAWALAAPWASEPALRCDVDTTGRWSVRTLTNADDRTWLASTAPPRVTGKPQCMHAAAERTAMAAKGGDVLVTRPGRARFSVTVGAGVRSGVVELPRMVVAVLGSATPGAAPTRWRPCVKVSTAELAAGSIKGAAHVVALHDVDGGRVFETKLALGPDTLALAGAVPGSPRYAYLVGSTVTLGCDTGCCHGADEAATLARHPGAATIGTFVDPDGVAVILGKTPARLVATRMHAAVDGRGAVALQPCVGLSADELAALQEQLAMLRRAAGGEVADRLRAGTSRLVALPIGAGGITVDDDGCVRLPAGTTEFTAHDELWSSEPGVWWFDKSSKQTLPALPATLAWPVLRVLRQPGKPSVRAALVEILLAAPRDRFDDSAKRRWDRVDALRRRVQQDLVAGWVDLAAVERDDPEYTADARWHRWRWLGKVAIGGAGRPTPGGDDSRGGVHLEVFAASNFIDRTIANGRWEELGADIDAEPRTPEFERAVETMLSRGRLGQLIHAKQAREELAGGARRPATWAEFCNLPDVAALLAEVVAVHTNEWTTPWGEVLKARDRGGPGVAHAPLADAWPSNAAALGLPAGKLRYYHPLRLLEWLTTGVSVRVHLLRSKPADVTASLGIGGEAGDGQEFELLAARGGDEITFFQRALLARSLPSDGAITRAATVTVHHTEAAIPEVPLMLRRGEITRVELCEPGSTVLRVASGVGPDDNGFLLADRAQRFDGAACNRVDVSITLCFNRDRPAKVELSLDHSNFRIVPRDSDAYAHAGDALHCTFVPVAGTVASAPPTAQQVRLYVALTSGAAVGVTGKLTVTVAGADGNPGATTTIEVGTRELGAAASEHGRDVEKLQLYLTRILAEGAPCYRKDRKQPTDAWRPGEQDGVLRAPTVLALWRFIVTFGGKGAWAPSFTKIVCEKGEYAIPNAFSGQQFEIPAPLDADARWTALDAEAKRLMTQFGRPRVGVPMIGELVRAAAMPHVLPRLTLALGAPKVAAPLSASAATLKAFEQALLLPSPTAAPEQAATLEVTAESVAGDPASVTLDVVLTGTAYVLPSAGAARRTLADLLAHGITLRPSGTIDGGAHALELRQGSSVLAKIALPGSRDLFVAKGGAGVDVLYVQRWLTLHHDADDKPYLPAVTGKWDKAGRRALEKFRADHLDATADFATVAAALAAPPAPKAAITPAPPPTAAGAPP